MVQIYEILYFSFGRSIIFLRQKFTDNKMILQFNTLNYSLDTKDLANIPNPPSPPLKKENLIFMQIVLSAEFNVFNTLHFTIEN